MSKTIKKLVVVCVIGALMAFTNSSNSEKVTDDTVVLKNNDLQVINAAIKHPNGKTHFFVGKYFHVYNTSTRKLERMALIGKDGWYGLPANVDASFMHPTNKKAYIFKGNMYYRYDFTKKRVDKTGIVGSDGFKGLNGPFDAAVMHPTNNKVYFFKANKYYSYDLRTKKVVVKNTGKDGWKGVPSSIDAMVMHKNGKAYAFKGDNYYRYNFSRRATDNLNSIIGRDGWKLFHQLDAAVNNDYDNNQQTFSTHYIRGKYGYYQSYEYSNIGIFYFNDKNLITKKRIGYDWYKGIPPNNIDAGFHHPKSKKYYFFKGDTYYRYNPKTKKVDKTAKIKDGFGLSKVSATAAIPNSNIIYLFLGIDYYLYDTSKSRIVRNGKIATKFKGIPNFIDAAIADKYGISFIKKNTLYRYNFNGRYNGNRRLPSDFFK